jgi:hypothetical protein
MLRLLATAGLRIFPPDSRPYGLSYAEWSIRWWQWITSLPRDVNPGHERIGTCCERNQIWPVWFLAGTFEEFVFAERECTMPCTMAIMFPAIVSEKSFAEYPELRTEGDLVKMASETNDRVKSAYVEIDGMMLPDIRQFRIRSRAFDLYLPENNIFGVRAGVTRSVSEGYWIILDSLRLGIHRIKFGGETYVKDILEFKTDVIYNLTVK